MSTFFSRRKVCIFTLVSFLFFLLNSNYAFEKNQDPLAEATNFFMQRNYEKAIPILDQFIESNLASPQQKLRVAEAFYLLAKIQFELRDDAKVAQNLKMLLSLVPDFEKKESNSSFKQILSDYKNNPINMGWQAYHKGDFGEAVKILEEFINKAQSDGEKRKIAAEAHYLLAKIFFESRDDSKAELHLLKVLEWIPEFSIPEENPGFKFKFSQLKNNLNQQKAQPQKSEIVGQPETKETGKIEKSVEYAAKEKSLKKKKFPWLLVAAGAVTLVALTYFVLLKKPTYTLSANVGEGVNGSPASGSYIYKKGKKVLYSYSLKEGYKNLAVAIDGITMPASGEITMDKNINLAAQAALLLKYKLDVSLGIGVEGTPAQGSFEYLEQTSVSYSYKLKSGYKDLSVMLDGSSVAAKGSLTMNANHAISITAIEEKKYYTLVVQYNDVTPLYGYPRPGTYKYRAGTKINFNYDTDMGDPDWAPGIEVYLNSSQIAYHSTDGPVSGSFTLNRDSTLIIHTG